MNHRIICSSAAEVLHLEAELVEPEADLARVRLRIAVEQEAGHRHEIAARPLEQSAVELPLEVARDVVKAWPGLDGRRIEPARGLARARARPSPRATPRRSRTRLAGIGTVAAAFAWARPCSAAASASASANTVAFLAKSSSSRMLPGHACARSEARLERDSTNARRDRRPRAPSRRPRGARPARRRRPAAARY